MRLTRKIVVEFVAVFLIGVVVGALLMGDFTDTELSRFMAKTNDDDSVMVARINQKYIRDYHLTQEELDRIQPLIKEFAQKMSHTRRQFGSDVLSTYIDYRQRMVALLKPEHQDIFKQATADRSKKLSELLKTGSAASADQGQN